MDAAHSTHPVAIVTGATGPIGASRIAGQVIAVDGGLSGVKLPPRS
jgi:hypothetical protein